MYSELSVTVAANALTASVDTATAAAATEAIIFLKFIVFSSKNFFVFIKKLLKAYFLFLAAIAAAPATAITPTIAAAEALPVAVDVVAAVSAAGASAVVSAVASAAPA